MLGRLNSPSSWGPGALSEEILRGPTLIKVKSVKSDFDRRAAPNFEAAFLRNQQSRRESRQLGATLPRAGYPPVPEAGGKNGQAPDLIRDQVGALSEEILKFRL